MTVVSSPHGVERKIGIQMRVASACQNPGVAVRFHPMKDVASVTMTLME